LGLKKQHTLTGQQFFKFISGGGIGNVPAYSALARRSVQIFTNTRGNPLAYFELDSERDEPAYTVLASYGLFVNRQGLLMSLANDFAPTKKANFLLPPLGYVDTWLVANGAASSWFQLYSSAYLAVAADGFKSQNLPQSVPAQLVTNTKAGESTHVGMSMAPALWLTNFCLVYTLSPDAAAEMPAYWAPIPKPVAKAILDSDYGVVPYSEYAKYFESR
jgi:hypothetical protein